MGSDDAWQLIILFILIFLSAFFSSAETALTTANLIRMRGLAEEGNAKAKRLLKIHEDSPKMLSAILIGNNIVNLTASSITTALALQIGGYAAGIATALLTVIIIILGEITPKTIATIHSDKMSLAYCNIIYALITILTPVIFLVNKLALGVLFLLRVDPKKGQGGMTETELRTIVDVSHESGVLEPEEREMINNVVDFGDSLAKDIMIPRIDMSCAEINTTYEELLDLFRKDMFSRLPVYSEDSDNVVGIINIKDLLFLKEEEKSDFQIQKLMREPFFTYEYKKTSDLMSEMRERSISMAIVLDEYGATAGLITLEDLLEEIVGEIRDEYDSDEINLIQQVAPRTYSIAGATKLDDLNDYLEANMTPEEFSATQGIPLDSEDYDTIGGIMIELLDHLPVEGEKAITPEGIYLKVETMDKNRIGRVRMRLPEPELSEEET